MSCIPDKDRPVTGFEPRLGSYDFYLLLVGLIGCCAVTLPRLIREVADLAALYRNTWRTHIRPWNTWKTRGWGAGWNSL